MKTITKIEAADTHTVKKLRVAAYARVSTDSEEQLISLDAQKNHYEVLIRSRRDWEYAGLYYDEGISGTSTRCLRKIYYRETGSIADYGDSV